MRAFVCGNRDVVGGEGVVVAIVVVTVVVASVVVAAIVASGVVHGYFFNDVRLEGLLRVSG